MQDGLKIEFTDINAFRAWCAVDFRRFNWYCNQLEGNETPPFHNHVANWLQSGYPVRSEWIGRTKSLLGFRLSAKTTLVCRRYVGWRWLRCPVMQVKIHSSNDDIAKEIARSLRRFVGRNPLLSHLDPGTNAGVYEWNLNGVEPEQGFSVTCAGIRTSLTGSRTDLYIFDDPEPDVNPESMRDRIISAIEESKHILHSPSRHLGKGLMADELPAPEKTQLLVVGQPHCLNSVYLPPKQQVAGVDGHPLSDAMTLIIDALDKDGNWTWPEMMASKYWNYQENRAKTPAEVEKETTQINWWCQMRVDPDKLRTIGSVLKLDEIVQAYRACPNAVMAIDTADSSEDGCEWGLSIGGIFSGKDGNNIHIAYMGGERGEAYEGDLSDESLGESVWRRIFDMAFEFGVTTVLLESNLVAAQRACRRFMRKAGIRMRVVDIRARSSKLARIVNTLDPIVNNGIMSASPDVMADDMNLHQLRTLRFDKLPKPNDRIDSLSMLCQHLLEYSDIEAVGDTSGIVARIGQGGTLSPMFDCGPGSTLNTRI